MHQYKYLLTTPSFVGDIRSETTFSCTVEHFDATFLWIHCSFDDMITFFFRKKIRDFYIG